MRKFKPRSCFVKQNMGLAFTRRFGSGSPFFVDARNPDNLGAGGVRDHLKYSAACVQQIKEQRGPWNDPCFRAEFFPVFLLTEHQGKAYCGAFAWSALNT